MKFPGNSCNTYISCPFKATSRKQSSCRSPQVVREVSKQETEKHKSPTDVSLQLSTKKSGRQCCADGESLKSDYASNTDSGHGPSEEGESSNKFHNQGWCHSSAHAFTCIHIHSHPFTCIRIHSHAFKCIQMHSHPFMSDFFLKLAHCQSPHLPFILNEMKTKMASNLLEVIITLSSTFIFNIYC